MRVPSSSFAESLINQLQQLTSRQAQLQNQAATGQRITNPSDDPAAVSRELQRQAEEQQLQQFTQNNAQATAISQTTYSAVSDLKSISDRAGELGVLGASVTSPDAYTAYATEMNQLIEHAVQTGNSQSSGNYIFGGVKTDSAPFTVTRDSSGTITSVSYQGGANAAQIPVGEGSTISPSTDGTTNQQFADFMNHLISLRDGLRNKDAASIQTANQNLQTSEDNLLVAVSNIGAVQTRLESDSSQNQARLTSLQTLSSQDTSVDLAQTVVKLTQAQTAYQAALQSGAQILQMSLLNYIGQTTG